ncbi:MAG: hypothetical protein P1U89_02980 [Verrucomicrobiales bacterium]|nr:hypothetical protein [Verrucomicrobiales bacterium]
MIKSSLILTVAAACTCLSLLLHAAEPVESIDFSTDSLGKKWKAIKGTWKVSDGKLSGAELASDKHAAVLFYPLAHQDSKVQVSFQLNGSENFHLSFNHPKGHLYRVIVSENEVRINLDKDKKDPDSKAVALAKAKGTFEQGKTYTLTCESSGDTVKATINDVSLQGTHEKLKMTKTGYRFIIKGEGVLFDDFVIHSKE